MSFERADLEREDFEKTEIETLLAQEPVDNADLLEVLRRGSAKILYWSGRADCVGQADGSGQALILRDGCGTVFFWEDGPEQGAREAAAWAALPYLPRTGLLCAHGELCARLAESSGWALSERCWQARYLGPEPPAPGPGVRLQGLDERYTDVVLEHYHFVDDEAYIRQRVSDGLMLGAFVRPDPEGPESALAGAAEAASPAAPSLAAPAPGETLAGFIGLHQEGGIGLLEVFPAYRRRGLAAALVQGMVRRRLAEGAIPFGHIVEGNEPSLRLQKKLGFSFSKEFVYWMD